MKGIINFYTNNDKVKKTFLGWEDTLNVEASTYKLFNLIAPVSQLEVEVASPKEDVVIFTEAIPTGSTWNDTDTTMLEVTQDVYDNISIYAGLEVDKEIVVVKEKVITAGKYYIAVFERGTNSTATTHSETSVITYLGYNIPRGIKDFEPKFYEDELTTNYMGKYTISPLRYEIEQITAEREQYGDQYDTYLASQVIRKNEELLKSANTWLLKGTATKGTSTFPSRTRGLIEEAKTRGNLITNFGKLTDLEKINVALTASQKKGGKANVLLCNFDAYNEIQKFATSTTGNQLPQTLDRLNGVVGQTITQLVTRVGILTLVIEREMPNDTIIILNQEDLFLAPHANPKAGGLPGQNQRVADLSTINDQAQQVDFLLQFVTAYKNTSRNTTIITGITY